MNSQKNLKETVLLFIGSSANNSWELHQFTEIEDALIWATRQEIALSSCKLIEGIEYTVKATVEKEQSK